MFKLRRNTMYDVDACKNGIFFTHGNNGSPLRQMK